MVKIGEAKNVNLEKRRKLNKSREEFINFAEIGGIYKLCGHRGNMQYASLA